MILGIVALAIPFVATSAASSSADRLIAAWSGSYQTQVFQESSVLATYTGGWNRHQESRQFMGSYAAISTQADAAVDFSFTGSGVSWIGPEGPNQGKARVYMDGRYVRTVDTYSRYPRQRESLFTASFSNVTDHTLTIHVLASTAGRVVTVDAFAVRDPLMLTETSAPAPTPPADPTPGPSTPAAVPQASTAPTPTPTANPTPTPTANPTPTPTAAPAPTANPTPTPTAALAPTPTAAPRPTPTAAPAPTPTAAPAPTPTAAPAPTPGPSAGPKMIVLTSSVTAAQFVSAVRDNTTDVIELAGGTYHVGRITLNADRTRPVVIRPAAGASVLFAGDGSSAAFWLGYGGRTSNITFNGLTFEGYTIGTTGLFDLGDAHDITMNNITVRNCTGQASYSWALYLEGAGPTNVIANSWTVDGNGKQYGAFTIEHAPGPQHVWLNGWHVTNVSYAIYSGGSASGTQDVNISNWTIDSSGLDHSVVLVGTPGTIKDVHATNTSGPVILSPMVDAGGNTWK